MTPTVNHGGATSGNSSVLSFISANMPKITRATMLTTVISGRLIAKSEIIIGVVPSGLLLGVGRGGNLHRRAGREPARRTQQQRVAGDDAGLHFQRLGLIVAQTELDLDPLNLASLDAHDRRTDTTLVHRGHRPHGAFAD